MSGEPFKYTDEEDNTEGPGPWWLGVGLITGVCCIAVSCVVISLLIDAYSERIFWIITH